MAGEFLVTLGDLSQLPTLLKGENLNTRSASRREPRIAMVGRSNVGKSSLINVLLGHRLAQTSNQPGKTRQIHFYLWKEASKIIADLPGYGYARAGKEDQANWAKFIDAYLRADEALERALVLLDARHGPTPVDLEALRFLAGEGIPLTIVFSKSDTLKTQSERAKRRKETAQALTELGIDPSLVFWVSSETRDGLKVLAKELGVR